MRALSMSSNDLEELEQAEWLLSNPGFAIKAANLLGTPIEAGMKRLPSDWSKKVNELTTSALMSATKVALSTMRSSTSAASPGWHKVAVAMSGAAGGAFGLATIAIELPISTTIMCRSIADVARANGENLEDVRARLACIEVFALGGTSDDDDAANTGYFATRYAMAKTVSDAAMYLAKRKAAVAGGPALVRAIGSVAARFQVQVTQKAAAQAVPIIGAASGALLNLMFIDHYQDVGRGHFTVRRLERTYGEDTVRTLYDEIARKRWQKAQ